jgi:hypothetical protein
MLAVDWLPGVVLLATGLAVAGVTAWAWLRERRRRDFFRQQGTPP